MAILDSSAIIHLLKGAQKGQSLQEKFETELTSTTSISINEVLAGIDNKHKLIAIDFLKGLEIIPFDERAAYKSAELEESLRKKGKMMGKLDLLIAAICLTHNIPLVTTDADFNAVQGLKILTV